MHINKCAGGEEPSCPAAVTGGTAADKTQLHVSGKVNSLITLENALTELQRPSYQNVLCVTFHKRLSCQIAPAQPLPGQ